MKNFKLNVPVRYRNKTFWLAFVPAILILIQTMGTLFGINIDVSVMQGRLINVVNAAFMVLTVIGVINDPTTEGLTDSEQALGYDKPKK